MESIVRKNDEFIDNIIGMFYEINGHNDGLEDCKVKHVFTPGLYTRIFFMPAGKYVVSRIHKMEHPFVVIQGEVKVSIDAQRSELIVAPYTGITKAGTRRLLETITDTVWITFHPTDIVPDSDSEEDAIKAGEKVVEMVTEAGDCKLFVNNKNEVSCQWQ